MKYLKYLEERDWDAIDPKLAERQNAAYRRQLLRLQPRLSKKAWNYFWLGFAETGIHDARLIALSAGDGLTRLPRLLGAPNLLSIKAEFLNQNGKLRFAFSYSQIKKFSFDFDATLGAYFIELSGGKYFFDRKHYLKNNHLDHVLGDELSAVDKTYLRHEFIFASSARIVVEAARISLQRKRVQRLRAR
ncbi:MAG: hypothetical protein LAO20_17530 [Acidobacteriia bacterium]|nr:hypothetical protein [Terriglobia bacterium]